MCDYFANRRKFCCMNSTLPTPEITPITPDSLNSPDVTHRAAWVGQRDEEWEDNGGDDDVGDALLACLRPAQVQGLVVVLLLVHVGTLEETEQGMGVIGRDLDLAGGRRRWVLVLEVYQCPLSIYFQLYRVGFIFALLLPKAGDRIYGLGVTVRIVVQQTVLGIEPGPAYHTEVPHWEHLYTL